MAKQTILALAIAFALFCNGCGLIDEDFPWTDPGGGSCDIKDYKTVEIGEQTWMAENYNCYVKGSKCHEDNIENCKKYGRLYDWLTAMALPKECGKTECKSQISEKHQGVCPSGWHIPSVADWDKLYHFADGTVEDDTSPYSSPTAGYHLRATSGWGSYSYDWTTDKRDPWCGPSDSDIEYWHRCEDTYGFSAIPRSYYDNFTWWWSSGESLRFEAYVRLISIDEEFAEAGYYEDGAHWTKADKGTNNISVRCVQD